MEKNTLPCDNCGGTNLELIMGHYHCSECLMMIQNIQEHEIDELDQKLQGIYNTKTAIKKQIEPLDKVKLTTWECYNYIIKGLIEELLILGADMLLRSVVKKLWFKYLLKLEVVNLEKPKLQAVNTKIDAEIVYGRNKRRKRKKSSKSKNGDLSSAGSMCSLREFTKKKKLLFNSQCEISLSKSIDNSVMDETLESLKNQSEISNSSSIPLKFNKYAKKELRKRQSENHLKKHSEDVENDLQCHRISYREASKKYQNSSYLLSINKIYSLLYLGLLLTKSKIQLADIIRFIREGHLSFNSFKHFFPVEVSDTFLTQVCRKSCLTSGSMRESTFQLAKFLDVLQFIEVQNLAVLVEKFCKELNLPGIIEKRTLSSLVVTLPKMKVDENMRLIPNYEARALSLILFQIKIFFSLDGKTEKHLSEQADSLNNINTGLNMFNFMQWLQYLDYRKCNLKKHHFPSEFASNKNIKNCDSFVKFMINRNPEYEKEDTDKKINASTQGCRQILAKLKDRQADFETIYFPPSFSPSIDYVRILQENHFINGSVEKEILTRNFRDSSLDCILTPSEHFKLLSEETKVKIQLESMNKNIKQNKLINLDTERTRKLKKDRKFHIVQLRISSKNASKQIPSTITRKYNLQYDDYSKNNKDTCASSERLRENEVNLTDQVGEDFESKKIIRFIPYESYWVNTHSNLGLLAKENFEQHFSTYPYNFQFLVREMARICEQSEQEFLEEFTLTEIYLLYGQSFQSIGNDNLNSINNDFSMKRIIAKAIKHW